MYSSIKMLSENLLIVGCFLIPAISISAAEMNLSDTEIEKIGKLCSGGYGIAADGERARIVINNKTVEVEAGNKIFFSDESGNFTKKIEISFEEYVNCLIVLRREFYRELNGNNSHEKPLTGVKRKSYSGTLESLK